MFNAFGFTVVKTKEYEKLQHDLNRKAMRVHLLSLAALDFIRKVDSGRAVSVDSYNKFKKALGE